MVPSIYRTSIRVFVSQSSMLACPVLKKNCEWITQLLHPRKNVTHLKHPLERGRMQNQMVPDQESTGVRKRPIWIFSKALPQLLYLCTRVIVSTAFTKFMAPFTYMLYRHNIFPIHLDELTVYLCGRDVFYAQKLDNTTWNATGWTCYWYLHSYHSVTPVATNHEIQKKISVVLST